VYAIASEVHADFLERAGASVRDALRRVAERERGLAAISASLGRIALDTSAKVGASVGADCGKWREVEALAPLA
jgi:hypothetical protein